MGQIVLVSHFSPIKWLEFILMLKRMPTGHLNELKINLPFNKG